MDQVWERVAELERILGGMDSIAVACSGGIDSAFLLSKAARACPGKTIAISVNSRFVPSGEIDSARKNAGQAGLDLVCIETDVFKDTKIVRNHEDRCYHCKKHIFSIVKAQAEERKIKFLVHGVNLDDMKHVRPGLKAARELGFIAPLADAGLAKADIRMLSKHMGLSAWNRPSQSCLATRIPTGSEIRPEDLARLDRAEVFLKNSGFSQVRVRCMGAKALIEVEPAMVAELEKRRSLIGLDAALSQLGFTCVEIDPGGYHPG